MKKQLIMTVLLTSSLCMQAGITTVLNRVRQSNRVIRPQQQRRYCQTGSTKQDVSLNDVFRKADEMAAKYGIGMRYFINKLNAATPAEQMAYLQHVDIHAQIRSEDIPSQEDFFVAWRKHQSKKE